MGGQMSKLLRAIQICFPVTQDYKFQFKRWLRGILKQTHEKDFDALAILPFGKGANRRQLFLDIGANRGEVIQTVLMKWPTTQVIAFEPNDEITQKLERIYRDDARVEIRKLALGSEDGTFDLLVPIYDGFMFDVLASFKADDFHRWLNEHVSGFNGDKLVIKKVSCAVRRLDDLNLKPDFIKIDVRGTEYEVLLGAERTLMEYRPVLMIEAPMKNVFAFLARLGYRSFIYTGSTLIPGETGGVHVFFIPDPLKQQ